MIPLLQIGGARTILKINFDVEANMIVDDFIVLEFPTKTNYANSASTGINSDLLFAEDLGGGLGASPLSPNNGY